MWTPSCTTKGGGSIGPDRPLTKKIRRGHDDGLQGGGSPCPHGDTTRQRTCQETGCSTAERRTVRNGAYGYRLVEISCAHAPTGGVPTYKGSTPAARKSFPARGTGRTTTANCRTPPHRTPSPSRSDSKRRKERTHEQTLGRPARAAPGRSGLCRIRHSDPLTPLLSGMSWP